MSTWSHRGQASQESDASRRSASPAPFASSGESSDSMDGIRLSGGWYSGRRGSAPPQTVKYGKEGMSSVNMIQSGSDPLPVASSSSEEHSQGFKLKATEAPDVGLASSIGRSPSSTDIARSLSSLTATPSTLINTPKGGSPKLSSSPLPSSSSFKNVSRTRTKSSTSPKLKERQLPGDVTPSRTPLVADVQLSKSRLLVTKTHILYPPRETVPFRSCVLAFRVIFHALTQGRVRQAEVSLRFFPAGDDPDGVCPVIKAIYPSHSTQAPPVEERTQVHRNTNTTLGVSIGYTPYGSLFLSRGGGTDYAYTSHPSVLGSGVESSRALFTIGEDPVAHTGVTPSLDLAVLLWLPEEGNNAFEAELSVEATVGRSGVGSGFGRLLGSPRVWRMGFDGETQLGEMQFGDMSSGVVEVESRSERSSRSPREATGGTSKSPKSHHSQRHRKRDSR
ncbi:uncharacterized protein L969DRAFT_432985 [Mixia osmundae IAM 14324]|uniref:Uncharacterized protein n=1 Tax=Mixia osmundae (strain CBS 9802 / IAM 14324 / JCM 22182 / KY 12970) TaxID=764103 RepID=G7E8H0_MIXOS|nr:uncharacterized protein L969DRAFT_432985 [Mixia osmundae IAM 14324]KEI39232.1 hypothetical protein L969DRAFT_432985 [Mixia osmundae IAM 14324]GAA99130.1 hypothetical protein E5Q_05820 [Mixia osmundae IAM 14324]